LSVEYAGPFSVEQFRVWSLFQSDIGQNPSYRLFG
jgi:hypothetical protein